MRPDIERAAKEISALQSDTDKLLTDMARRFKRALPGRVRVVRSARFLGGRVTEMDIDLESVNYRLESRKQGSLAVRRQAIVNGIAVGQAENFAAPEWPARLAQDLDAYVTHAQLDDSAVARLVT
ncbi:MAG: hypothetical protein ACR2MY_08070 [Candidatus Dormibacteria bacterium]